MLRHRNMRGMDMHLGCWLNLHIDMGRASASAAMAWLCLER
jgi:hypothetical protein